MEEIENIENKVASNEDITPVSITEEMRQS